MLLDPIFHFFPRNFLEITNENRSKAELNYLLDLLSDGDRVPYRSSGNDKGVS